MAFQPIQSKSRYGRSSGGFGAAAGMVDLASAFQAQRRNAPPFDEIYATGIANRANERSGIMDAKSAIIGQGLDAASQIGVTERLVDAKVDGTNRLISAHGDATTKKTIGAVVGAGLRLASLSDRDTKENIERLDDALATLRQLKPVSFNYLPEYSTSPERLHYGFIAQEYREVMPDATYYDESVQKYCIDPVELIGLLVRSVQQLETRVQYLEATKALAELK